MTRYNTTRKQKGGTKIFGEGRKGITYYPALPCANRNEQPSGNVVSKVTTREEARSEFLKTRILRKKNYDFTCHPIEACKGMGQNNKGERWLLFSNYGGIPIAQVQSNFRRQFLQFQKFKEAIKQLRLEVQQMNADGIFHNDITVQNITYDEATGKAYLIDFGDLSSKNEGDDGKIMDQTLEGLYLDLKDFWNDTMTSEDKELFESFDTSNSLSETNERFTDSH